MFASHLVQFPAPLLTWIAGVVVENPRTASDDHTGEKMVKPRYLTELAVGASANIYCRCSSRVAVGKEMANLWRPHRLLPPLQRLPLDSLRCPKTCSYRSDLRGSRRFPHSRHFSYFRGFQTESFPVMKKFFNFIDVPTRSIIRCKRT